MGSHDLMKPPQISLEKILALEPACLRMTVPEAYRDENGHMNVRWYAAIFDEAGDTFHERLGLTPEFHNAHGTGTMDLENHFNYLHEVRAGDHLAIFSRLVAHSAKRMQYLMFIVDETRGKWSETSKFGMRPCYRTSPHRVKEREGMQNFETRLVMETRLHCPAK
jgi:acyl-CoA thioesterase FadM